MNNFLVCIPRKVVLELSNIKGYVEWEMGYTWEKGKAYEVLVGEYGACET